MEPSVFQQIFDHIAKSNRILIALPHALSADSYAGGVGLGLFLRQLSKTVDLASSGSISAQLSFLPESGMLKNTLARDTHLVISVDTTTKEVGEISYNSAGNRLDIFIKPKGEAFVPSDVGFRSARSPYDLIVILGCATLEDLGPLFEENADVFYDTPKINVDIKPNNSHFGAINCVDINSASLAELLADMFESEHRHLINEHIATCLLTGIISTTNSFQHAHTTPKAFLKASELIALGGRQQEIVQYLYKTKPLRLLRLWGRALARLKTSEESGILYSLVGRSDFEKSGAEDRDLPDTLNELLDNVSGYKAVGLLAEQSSGIRLLIALRPSFDEKKVFSLLGLPFETLVSSGTGYKVFSAKGSEWSLAQGEERLVSSMREIQPVVLPETGQ